MTAKIVKEEVEEASKTCGHNYPSKCNAHAERNVTLFCVTCEEGICLMCITENTHGLHRLCQLNEVAEIKQKQFQNLLREKGAENLKVTIELKTKEITTKKHAILASQEKLKTAICNRSKYLRNLIVETEQRLSLISSDWYAKQVKFLDDEESKATRYLSLLERFSYDSYSLREEHKNDMFPTVKYLRGLKTTNRTDVDSLPSFQCDLEMTGDMMQEIFGVFKTPGESSESKPATGRHSRLVGEMKLEHAQCGNFVSMRDTHRCSINKISVVDSNTAYILLGETLYKIKFAPRLVQHKVSDKVQDITHVSESGLYFCTASCLKFCTFENKLFELDTITDPETRFVSVCITKNGNIVCCSEEDSSFAHGLMSERTESPCDEYTLAPDGSRVNHTTSYIKGSRYRIAEHQNEIYVVERRANHGLVLKSNKKYSTKSFVYEGKIGCNPAKLFDPKGICFDAKGQIIIADCNNHAIHLLDKDGKFKKFLLRQWEGLEHPTAVAIDKLGFLWIGQKNGTIQIRSYES